MLVHVSYAYASDDRDKVHERFRATGGLPPDAVTMVARWHAVDGNRGFLLAETEDPAALARWLQEWTDLIAFEVTPVLTDEQFSEVIG